MNLKKKKKEDQKEIRDSETVTYFPAFVGRLPIIFHLPTPAGIGCIFVVDGGYETGVSVRLSAGRRFFDALTRDQTQCGGGSISAENIGAIRHTERVHDERATDTPRSTKFFYNFKSKSRSREVAGNRHTKSQPARMG